MPATSIPGRSPPLRTRAWPRCVTSVTRVVLLGTDASRAGARSRRAAGARLRDAARRGCARRRRHPRMHRRCRRSSSSDDAHAAEHALEVQLPFLQSVLGTFTLVPFAVGRATPDDVAAVLDALWGGPETLIVVSSDLSHYHAYADARRIDRDDRRRDPRAVAESRSRAGVRRDAHQRLAACARRRGLEPALLDLRNSGDTAGDRSRVVGYASFAFTDHGTATLTWVTRCSRIARAAIRSELGLGETAAIRPCVARRARRDLCHAARRRPPARLHRQRGTRAARSARTSARTRSPPRFATRAFRRSPRTNSRPRRSRYRCSARASPFRARMRTTPRRACSPGSTASSSQCGRHRATFLPQVWEQLPDPREFLVRAQAQGRLAGRRLERERDARALHGRASSANGRRCQSDAR